MHSKLNLYVHTRGKTDLTFLSRFINPLVPSREQTMLMASLRGENHIVPLCLPIDSSGVVWVEESMISHRFKLFRSSIWIEREVYDDDRKKVVATVLHQKIVQDTVLT